MTYPKPNKQKANADYLRSIGFATEDSYNEEQKDQNKTFLIICEGENTEPSYFKAFPVPTNVVEVIGGCNSRTAFVDGALRLKNESKYSGREVWCVFDYDVHPEQSSTQQNDFNSAINKAELHGMKCAWSNDAFELWFVLHYDKLETPLSRKELYQKLKKEWHLQSFQSEAKTADFCAGHYQRHGGMESEAQKLAIRHAKGLHESYNGSRDFAKQCPCTTVYLLVEELNKCLKR